MRAIASGAPSQSGYVDYLGRQHRVHAPLEQMLATALPSSWTEQRLVKTDWLREDLAALGVDVGPSLLPRPQPATFAEGVGSLYVLEGAMLGMQLVRRRIETVQTSLPGKFRFLSGYGSDSGRLWQEFLQQLETLPGELWESAAAGATATFGHFHHVFGEVGHE
jgi:heme oxygenase